MIIKSLLGFFQNIIIKILGDGLPSVPEDVWSFIQTGMNYITGGVGILGNFIDFRVAGILFGIVVSIDVFSWLYKLVMWVLRKIPMVNVS